MRVCASRGGRSKVVSMCHGVCRDQSAAGGDNTTMNRWQKLVAAAILSWAASVGGPGSVAAQTKPEGEMRFALYVTLAPAWLDPGEAVPDNLTPFWMMYALHDELVKPMPGNFMAFYGTLASAAGWITPKNYFEKVGPDGFLQHPIGLGPYKFVSMKSGIELVMEANEDYWRKVPSVKRLVFRSVPEGTTRLSMLKSGEVDVAYLLEGELGESIRDDPKLKLAFSGGIGTFFIDFFDMWDPKSPWADQRVRKA